MRINLKNKNGIFVSCYSSFCFCILPIVVYGINTRWFRHGDNLVDKVYRGIGTMKNYDN